MTWDQDRVCGVVRKIVQGLYFKEFGKPAPKRSIFKMDFVHNEDPRLSAVLAAGDLRDRFAPDFTYRVVRVSVPPTTLWQLTFYGDVHWLCAVHDFEVAG